MDIKEYISSGIIESYVMGLASEEEASILECVRLKHPEVEQAIQEAQVVLEDLATTQAILPDAVLKQVIWEKLVSSDIPPVTPVPTKEAQATPNQSPDKGRIPKIKPYAIAATAALVLSVLGNLYLYQHNNQLDSTIKDLAVRQQQSEQKLADAEQRWALVQQPGVKTIALQGIETRPSLKALVLWDSQHSTVYLSAQSLPKAPSGKQYQLWAIVDGAPVDAGILPLDGQDALVRMRDISKASAFAITLEPQGGSSTPTLSEMYVIGNI